MKKPLGTLRFFSEIRESASRIFFLAKDFFLIPGAKRPEKNMGVYFPGFLEMFMSGAKHRGKISGEHISQDFFPGKGFLKKIGVSLDFLDKVFF